MWKLRVDENTTKEAVTHTNIFFQRELQTCLVHEMGQNY